MRKTFVQSLMILVTCISVGSIAFAQGTAFTYQGSLNTSGNPANGDHDFEFALFNSGGAQIGATITRLNVPVANGIFTVELDFGNQFQGSDRLLEVRVRTSGGGAFTTLAPRRTLTSAPHAIRSLDSAQLGGLSASQYVTTGASVISAAQQFNISASRVLGTSNNSLFVGSGSGQAQTSGSLNTLVGTNAGLATTTGSNNTFVGANAGASNTTAGSNTFFGAFAGSMNITGANNAFFGTFAGRDNTASGNSFFGSVAGSQNTTGIRNSFFGFASGSVNTVGSENVFVGFSSGALNSTGSSNTFVGSVAGNSNTTGINNVFIGRDAGRANSTASNNTYIGAGAAAASTGTGNTFVGSGAGAATSAADNNSFFGRSAGAANSAGSNNSFFGSNAASSNTSGSNNAFFGVGAGFENTTGSANSFFGGSTGINNSTGASNSAFGSGAAGGNSTGNENSYFGAASDSSDGLTNATAIGARSFVTSNNSIVLGAINGINGATANTRVGIGTTAPTNRLTIGEPEASVLNGAVGLFNDGGTFVTARDTTNDVEAFFGADSNGALFGSMTNSFVRIRTNNTNRLTIDGTGVATFTGSLSVNSFIVANTLDAAGATALCRNASNRISTCSSSLRYKSNVRDFSGGLDLLKKLRPVTFDWKGGGPRDLGLVAEEVAAAELLLTTTNASGEVEGVKYDRVGVVLVNAVREQQAQIESLRALVAEQQKQLETMKRLVCAVNASAEICKP